MRVFNSFRLDTVNQCLWREDQRILLTPKAFAVLRYLVERAGRLVTQSELLDALWPDTYVQPEVLKGYILDIRTALGDRPKNPLFIETLHRRGYRFIAAVREDTSAELDLAAPRKLVGRDATLGELQGYLRKVLKGERQVIFITGEPGIGKTTLVDAFQHQAAAGSSGIRIACGQCIEGHGTKEAYYPILEAVGQLCRGPGSELVVQTLAAQAPTWLVQFPALLKREHRETLQREILGTTRERMLREICEALQAIAVESPLVLIFEDAHWVDHSTVDLVSAIARGRARSKLMLLATYRPVEVVLSQHPLKALKQDLALHRLCHEFSLDPLDEPAVAEYLAAGLSENGLPDGLAKLVHQHSEGNPLFMVAAVDHMVARRLISKEDGRWKLNVPLQEIGLGVPETLRQMIELQTGLLSAGEQRVLEAASVTGVSFAVCVSAAATELDPESFEDLCEQLAQQHQFVHSAGSQQFPDGTVSQCYQFVHALYGEVLYRRQAPGRRSKLHMRIGERLEALFSERLSEVTTELALHFEKSHDWVRAVKYLRLAAENAQRRYAHHEAATTLRHALELLNKLPEADRGIREPEILEKLGTVYLASGDGLRAGEAFEALAAQAVRYRMIDVEVRALIDLAFLTSWTSSQRCLEALERALTLNAEQKDPLIKARRRMSIFFMRLWTRGWDPQDADECRAALAEIRRDSDRLLLASHLTYHSFIQWSSSDYREARWNTEQCLPVLLEGGDYVAYLNAQLALIWELLFLGEWGDTLQALRFGIEMAEKNWNYPRAHLLRLYKAWLYLHAMDYAGALEICNEAFPYLGDRAMFAVLRTYLVLAGSAEAGLGNYERALEHFLEARDSMDRQQVIFDWYWRIPLQSGLTELWLRKGDLTQARQEGQRFLEVALATAERTWQALAWEINARIAMSERDREKGQDHLGKAMATMQGFEVPLASWRVHATAAEFHASTRHTGLVEHHRQLSKRTILKLADSLGEAEPLRESFLSALPVRKVLGNRGKAMLSKVASSQGG
jgi:DNA-binding winged helix-turn-helix (wHTH) protein/tetratricopeptide (TPR) repeat protein